MGKNSSELPGKLKRKIKIYIAKAEPKPFDTPSLSERRESIYRELALIGVEEHDIFYEYIKDLTGFRGADKRLTNSRTKLIEMVG